jgi:16S rRNA (adenine1518-N6/adenine1519-N6)-dimethyltransferase
MKAKKSLGQNWLQNPTILTKICQTGKVQAGDTVLEIGPGTGALTEGLLATGARVIAVEKDRELIPLLEGKFFNQINAGQLTIVEQDVLTFDPSSVALLKPEYKVIANIPYYITGQFLRQFLSADHQPELMVLMVQKEVATRIVARDGKESILSISVKAYAEPRYVTEVSRGNFSPMPNVDSAILAIENISRKRFELAQVEEGEFFELVRRGFGQKRKQLKNNLACAETALAECGLTPKVRAEELSINHWLCLTQKLH